MKLFLAPIVFLFGLAVGSFIGAYTYRWPRSLSVKKGRSFCPNCKKKISWYDNFPLLSYIILRGRCRNCSKKISLRYPLIELSLGLIFVVTYYFYSRCTLASQGEAFCAWNDILGWWTLPYLLIVSAILLAIFVIDFEHQLIPDELIFFLITLTIFAHIIGTNDKLYSYLLSGFAVSVFLLLLNLATYGRGMGMGDVKLVIPLGLILGWPYILVFLFLSFILGAVVGLVLIAIKRARFGKHIAFGPFLIIASFATLFFGEALRGYLIPYL